MNPKMRFLCLLICATFLLDETRANSASKSCGLSNFFHRKKGSSVCGVELFRLPTDIQPVNYDLLMKTDLGASTFSGQVDISLRIQNVATNKIILHAASSLSVHAVKDYIDRESGKSIAITKICHDPKYELLVVTLAKKLKPSSQGLLSLKFEDRLRDDLLGFYKSYYAVGGPEQSVNDRYLALTQFESTNARRAFPCFDEPNFKATFSITVVAPSDRVILANTDIQCENQLASGERSVKFEPTPPMPPYLVAFVVGDFEKLAKELTHFNQSIGMSIRIWTPIGRAHEGQVALEAAERSIRFMQDYYDINYPLRKLDLVSIPDFKQGAMENWGLITFKEDRILVDRENSSPDEEAFAVSTVVHEVAHQWFGNLVTMKWWSDLWLKEAFATWMQHKFVDTLYPEYDFNYYYLKNSLIKALNEDARRRTKPVIWAEAETQGPDEIECLFSVITYDKGAAIIRMLDNNLLGNYNFKLGVRKYLKEHQYKNAVSKNLWETMEDFNDKRQMSVGKFMNSWLSQPGFPLIKMRYEPITKQLNLTQERFLQESDQLTAEEREQRWIVPLSIRVRNREQEERMEILWDPEEQGDTLEINLPDWYGSGESWIKINSDFSGYYRVQMPWKMIELLETPIRKENLSPADRINILDDVMSMVRAKLMFADKLKTLMSWYEGEKHGAVIERLEAALKLVRPFGVGSVDAFGETLFHKILTNLGGYEAFERPHKSRIESQARASVWSALIGLGDSGVIKYALNLFDKGHVEPELRRKLYPLVATQGTDEQFERLFQLAQSNCSGEQLTSVAIGLASAETRDRLERAWQWLVDLKRPLQWNPINLLYNMRASLSGRNFVEEKIRNRPEDLVTLNYGEPADEFLALLRS